LHALRQTHRHTDALAIVFMERVNSLCTKTEIIITIINRDADFSSLLGNEGPNVQRLPDADSIAL
jgi:hypothetical protein